MNRIGEVTILLPVYNEEEAIGPTIDDVLNYVSLPRIIVVDSASDDDTVNIANNKGIGVEVILVGRGKGNAIRSVIQRVDTEYCIMMDSDFTYPAEYIPDMLDLLEHGVDVVIGYRDVLADGAMTRTNRFGNKALSRLASVLYGRRVRDVCSGMWGFRTEVLKKMHLTSPGFTLEADLFVNAVRLGCHLGQIPISYRARLDGSKAKLKVRDGFKIGWFLVRKTFHTYL